MTPPRDAVIVDVLRTPVGKGKKGGALSHVHPVHLLADVLAELVRRNDLDPALVDDVIAGCVTKAGEQAINPARSAVLAAGFPLSVPATTVDRQCGSSQQAVHFAAHAIQAGAADVVIACGVESMSRVPMHSDAQGADHLGARIAERFPGGGLIGQGLSAELICARWKLDRDELDEFSAVSHQRAAAAHEAFVPDLATVTEAPELRVDETVRPTTTVDKLAALRPSFVDDAAAARFPEIDWKITPGNSSPLTDGAAAVLMMSAEKAERLGLTPRARVHATAVVGDDPIVMLMGVVPATRAVLERAGLTADDIDLFEVNEAFAPVPLAWMHDLGVEHERLNVHGGAIALGHPLGASGARIMTTLVGALERRGARFGLQTMCEWGGMANATIVERL
ncbi:thiolase family protein [Amycolatopsis thermophila]|uniref:Acetyl-CoA acyltransferase n=1 Tax=Amycolatopsis thermophila TaxID=206084 RepID=A0ABU0F0W7_9PSEU|nr:thiolase family protein [Amycolatopsis thermophila]MDQ0381148.1 acetyl-CoA acyltransferase [Amycolatopsis thermophila]